MTTKIPVELSSTPSIVDNGDATAITIDSSERVGLNGLTPSDYYNTADDLVLGGSSGHGITIVSGTSENGAIFFADGTSGNAEYEGYLIYEHGTNVMRFATSATERMRIDSSGNLLVGKTSATQSSAGFQISGSNFHNVTSTNTSNGSSTFMVHDGSQLNFYVNFTGQVFYRVGLTNLSDQRLKENVINLDKGLDDILKIKPRRFDWIEGEGEKNQIGFIAQEVEEAGLEELVSHYKGASLDDAKGVNQAGLIPILVKAIQEQQTIIEDLQTQINEVKNGN